jgi:hypothetical protein
LYGWVTWFLALRKQNILRIFENRIFGSKDNKIIGGWRKLHNEKLHNLYSSPNNIRMIKSRGTRGTWHIARMREKKTCRVFVGKLESSKLLEISAPRWEDNTKMDFGEVGWVNVDWINLA